MRSVREIIDSAVYKLLDVKNTDLYRDSGLFRIEYEQIEMLADTLRDKLIGIQLDREDREEN